MDGPIDDTENIIESSITELYKAFYRLRISGQHQREYDTMGVLINMLQQDRARIRRRYNING